MHIKPGLVTAALVSATGFFSLTAALYPLLETSAPPSSAASIREVVITGGDLSRSAEASTLASMKSVVMGYDAIHATVAVKAKAPVAPPPAPPVQPAYTPPPAVSPAATPSYPTSPGQYSYAALEQIWVANGGAVAREATAACIAEHESGGRADAISPTNDYGLWQEHDDPAALSPTVSARTAVEMSDNGTNWSAWTTAGDCGV